MIKQQKDLVAGDIIRVEFGDFDNWVTVVVDGIINNENEYCGCNILCHYLDGKCESMWGSPTEETEVIGEYHENN